MNLRMPVTAYCFVLTLLFAAAPAFADEPLPIEKAFARAQSHLRVVTGDVKHNGDAVMDVYLKGGEIVCLDYTDSTTDTLTHQQFYLEKGVPVLAVETISARRDDRGKFLGEPRVRSVERCDVTPGAQGKKTQELRDRGQELLKYYHAHRKNFEENND